MIPKTSIFQSNQPPIASSLTAPVGYGQANRPEDVRTVRRLLNRLLSAMVMGPAIGIPEDGPWDERVASTLDWVERVYFHGVADPDRSLETGDSLFQLLLNADLTRAAIPPQISLEMYELASQMVPGGMDVRRVKVTKVPVLENGKTVLKRHVEESVTSGTIRTHLPNILRALADLNLSDTPMVMMALGTIRAEASRFEPVDEGVSKYNTTQAGKESGHLFDKYDNRKESLGNLGYGEGAKFKGRGFVQLTGRANYTRIGTQLGIDLVENPELANDPALAARILAQFLKNSETSIRRALDANNLSEAREKVNGGHHGLKDFKESFASGRKYLGTVIAQRIGPPRKKKKAA